MIATPPLTPSPEAKAAWLTLAALAIELIQAGVLPARGLAAALSTAAGQSDDPQVAGLVDGLATHLSGRPGPTAHTTRPS